MSGDHIQEGYASLREAAAANDRCTKHGLTWLVKTLDPYHDRPLEIRGLPDHCESRTVIRELRSSVIVNNTDLTSDATWACHVDLLPISRPILAATPGKLNAGLITYVEQVVPPSVTGTLYPLTISKHTGTGLVPGTNQCWPNGSYSDLYTFNNVTNSLHRSGLSPNWTDYDESPYRVIGAAFEVVNTTAALYKNGTCSVYRVNSEFDVDTAYVGFSQSGWPVNLDETIYSGLYCDAAVISLPLNSTDDMAPLPTFQQWGAEEGCYVVGVLDPECMSKFTTSLDCRKWFGINRVKSGDNQCLGSFAPFSPFTYDPEGGGTSGDTLGVPYALHLNALQTCGAYFNNLDPHTVLQINVRWIIESIPDAADQDMTLANISAEYDPYTLELYARTIRKLPAGVPVRMNPFGEWFETAMDIVSTTAKWIGAGIGAMLDNPEAGYKAGSYVGYGAEFLASKNKRSREAGGKIWF